MDEHDLTEPHNEDERAFLASRPWLTLVGKACYLAARRASLLKKENAMPLAYDDVPGSWGTQSEGWPSTPYTMGKWLLCTKVHVVPYGSYVVVGSEKSLSPGGFYRGYDYSKAVIRVENEALLKKLEYAYHGMFIECRSLLIKVEIQENPVH